MENIACYMCDNARINDELTDDNDFSYITIGSMDKTYRLMLRVGSGKPLQILVEHYERERWNLVGFYTPPYCPNCGRKIVEFSKPPKED